MRSSSSFIARLGLAALLGWPGAASLAAEVTLIGWAFEAGNAVSGNHYQGRAGGFAGQLQGAGGFDTHHFITYCVELSESFSFSHQPMTGYQVVDGASYFGADKAEALGRLVSYASSDATRVDTAAESTSYQLAIWNLVYDDDWSVSVAGSFDDRSRYAPYADGLLHGAASVPENLYDIFALRRRGSQDFLLAGRRPDGDRSSAPLPSSLLLAGLALAALVSASARFRRGAAR